MRSLAAGIWCVVLVGSVEAQFPIGQPTPVSSDTFPYEIRRHPVLRLVSP
jgi:hypothetical protein